MHRRLIHLSIIFTFIALASFFAYTAYSYSKKYEEVTLLIVKENTVNNLASIKLKKVGDMLSFGLYDGYKEMMNKRQELLKIKEYYHKKSIHYTLLFVLVLTTSLLLYFIIDLALFNIAISLMALISLTVGVLAPIMMMSIHKNVELLGDITLTVQSKSLGGTLSTLFESGEFVVALFLFIFSILLPLLKNFSLIFVSIFIQSKFAHSVVHFFKLLGKWSMADVFVVATLLVFLSNSGDGSSQAEIEVGLYFFMAYVIISMIATLSTDRLLHITKGT